MDRDEYNSQNFYDNGHYNGGVNPYATRYGTGDSQPQQPQSNGGFDSMRQVPPRQEIPPFASSMPPQQPYGRPYNIPQQMHPQMPPQQPIQQPQMPPVGQPMFFQGQNHVSNQDYEDQFDFNQNQNMQMGMAPNPQMRPQPQKKRGLFGFMKKTNSVPQQEQIDNKPCMRFYEVTSYEDIKKIIIMLRTGDPVYVDLARVNVKDEQRMVDFLSGAVFALGGIYEPLGEKRVMLTPPGMGFDGHKAN